MIESLALIVVFIIVLEMRIMKEYGNDFYSDGRGLSQGRILVALIGQRRECKWLSLIVSGRHHREAINRYWCWQRLPLLSAYGAVRSARHFWPYLFNGISAQIDIFGLTFLTLFQL